MNKPKRLPKEKEIDYLQRACNELNKQGYYLSEISDKMQIPEFEVYNYIQGENPSRITTEAERNYMILLRSQGKSYQEIADRVGRSKSCVRARIASPAKYNDRGGSLLSDKDIQKIKKWYIDGKSISWIAKKLNVSRYNIQRRLQKCDLYGTQVVSDKDLSCIDKRKINKLYKKGTNTFTIAKELGRDPKAIIAYLANKNR